MGRLTSHILWKKTVFETTSQIYLLISQTMHHPAFQGTRSCPSAGTWRTPWSDATRDSAPGLARCLLSCTEWKLQHTFTCTHFMNPNDFQKSKKSIYVWICTNHESKHTFIIAILSLLAMPLTQPRPPTSWRRFSWHLRLAGPWRRRTLRDLNGHD